MISPSNAAPEVYSKQILVVDDQVQDLTTLAEALSLHGAAVDTSTKVFIAIELLANIDYDILLWNIEMPAIRGSEFLRRTRSLRQARQLLSIAFSRLEGGSTEASLPKDDFDYILRAPISVEALTAALRLLKTHNGV